MIASAIRELSASRNPAWIAAAFFEETIQIWDVRSHLKIAEFPTVFCAGARNLAFTPCGRLLVTAKSTGRGVLAGYDSLTGELLWEHRPIAYPSRVSFSAAGDHLWCTVDGNHVEFLDPKTGSTVNKISGTSAYMEGPGTRRLTVPARKRKNVITLTSQNGRFELQTLTFALLDASFAEDCVCLTEASGPLRCISLANGKERWRFVPEGGHVVQLCYSASLNVFFGVLLDRKDGRRRKLLRFDAENGASREICALDGWEQVFLPDLEQIVMSSGEIRSLRNGEIVRRLPFPVKEYPDPMPSERSQETRDRDP